MRVNGSLLKYEIISKISNYLQNIISANSWEKTNSESPTTILKETWGTCFFTPKLMRTATSMTGGSWNLNFEPNKVILDPRVRNKGSKYSTEMVAAQFSPSSTNLWVLVQAIM